VRLALRICIELVFTEPIAGTKLPSNRVFNEYDICLMRRLVAQPESKIALCSVQAKSTSLCHHSFNHDYNCASEIQALELHASCLNFIAKQSISQWFGPLYRMRGVGF
jgi:hypothetical protein